MILSSVRSVRPWLVLALFVAAPAWAGPYEDLGAELNTVSAQQIQMQAASREREEKLAAAMRSGEYDTPEIVALRTRVAELKKQVVAAQQELQAQLEALPVFKDEVERVKAERTRIAALDRKRRELLARRATFFEKPAPDETPAPPAEAPEAGEKPAAPAPETPPATVEAPAP